MQEVRVCDYEYWIKWARLLSPMHSENARKTSSSSTGLPLQSKSVKTWKTEVWRWSFSVQWETFCRRINVPDYTTRWSKKGWNILVLKGTATRLFNVATAKFDSVKDVWLPILSLRIWRQTFRQALPHECDTSLYNREKSNVSASFATWMWNKLV